MENLKNILQEHLTALHAKTNLLYAPLSDSQKAKLEELKKRALH